MFKRIVENFIPLSLGVMFLTFMVGVAAEMHRHLTYVPTALDYFGRPEYLRISDTPLLDYGFFVVVCEFCGFLFILITYNIIKK